MHAGELLGDRMLRAVLLFRQPLDPPDIGKKLANLLRYVLAILLSHESTGSAISLLQMGLISDTASLDIHPPAVKSCPQWAPSY